MKKNLGHLSQSSSDFRPSSTFSSSCVTWNMLTYFCDSVSSSLIYTANLFWLQTLRLHHQHASRRGYNVPRKDVSGHRSWLSLSNQIKVSHQWPLKVFNLYFFLSSHCWGKKCSITPWCKNFLGAILCWGQTWKALKQIQVENRRSLD